MKHINICVARSTRRRRGGSGGRAGAWTPRCWLPSARRARSFRPPPSPGGGREAARCDGSSCCVDCAGRADRHVDLRYTSWPNALELEGDPWIRRGRVTRSLYHRGLGSTRWTDGPTIGTARRSETKRHVFSDPDHCRVHPAIIACPSYRMIWISL